MDLKAPKLSFKLLLSFETSLGLAGLGLIVLLDIPVSSEHLSWPGSLLLGLLAGWLSYLLLLKLHQWAGSSDLVNKLALHQIYRIFPSLHMAQAGVIGNRRRPG